MRVIELASMPSSGYEKVEEQQSLSPLELTTTADEDDDDDDDDEEVVVVQAETSVASPHRRRRRRFTIPLATQWDRFRCVMALSIAAICVVGLFGSFGEHHPSNHPNSLSESTTTMTTRPPTASPSLPPIVEISKLGLDLDIPAASDDTIPFAIDSSAFFSKIAVGIPDGAANDDDEQVACYALNPEGDIWRQGYGLKTAVLDSIIMSYDGNALLLIPKEDTGEAPQVFDWTGGPMPWMPSPSLPDEVLSFISNSTSFSYDLSANGLGIAIMARPRNHHHQMTMPSYVVAVVTRESNRARSWALKGTLTSITGPPDGVYLEESTKKFVVFGLQMGIVSYTYSSENSPFQENSDAINAVLEGRRHSLYIETMHLARHDSTRLVYVQTDNVHPEESLLGILEGPTFGELVYAESRGVVTAVAISGNGKVVATVTDRHNKTLRVIVQMDDGDWKVLVDQFEVPPPLFTIGTNRQALFLSDDGSMLCILSEAYSVHFYRLSVHDD